MGKALYREYRPKSLDTVVGQEHITDTLRNALKKDAISHAYLFTGPRGVGKTSVARILAYEINGIPYEEEATHLDIIEIDAASNRRIDEIRDLRDKVNIMPTSAKYKVYIIDEVHMLTREAFNALLKTLEEPPKHVVFILATTEAHKVPDTIISRTQRYSFKPITKDSATLHLRTIADLEKLKITDEALELIAEHGRGSFRDSISILDQISSIASGEITKDDISDLLGVPNDDTIRGLITSVRDNNSTSLFTCIQVLKEQGSNPSNIVQAIISMLHESLVVNSQILPPKKSVELMKQLLPLSGTYSSFEGVEIALLDAMEYADLATESKVESRRSKVESEESNAKSTESKVEIRKSEVETEEIAENSKLETQNPTAETSNNSWDGVLNTLRSTHNTLYGVLRMADITIDDKKVVLTFQFEFHKKQLEQSKNMSILENIIGDQLGKDYEIHSIVRKKHLPKPKTKIVEQSDDALDSVSNIFGGAELLES